ncbi:hypothetical protein COV15_00810 [Candidatus Woesearchaeota archaeon CG10_big_fil_rev_8_21_14_0_10_34_12]|nr:MAG: hypothetical protein COV15_00810 [Candidatus Woesearchaeota archaeon CG10_big_fil_rev_8_21_14_0_10_34_12]
MKLRDVVLAGSLILGGCFLENRINKEVRREILSFPRVPFAISADKNGDFMEAYKNGKKLMIKYYKRKKNGECEEEPSTITIQWMESGKSFIRSYDREDGGFFKFGEGFTTWRQIRVPAGSSFKREQLPSREPPKYDSKKDTWKNWYPRRG